jgi:polyisoprenoid-binding protein YceI
VPAYTDLASQPKPYYVGSVVNPSSGLRTERVVMLTRGSLVAVVLAGLAFGDSQLRAADTYKIDAVHSTVLFRVKHMGASYSYGRFNAIDGTFALDAKSPTQAAFDVTLKTDSIDTHNAGREKHLMGPDFFNAAQFPTIHFKSKSVAGGADGALDVAGELTLHGVTKPVQVTLTPTGMAKDPRGRTIAGVEGTFKIKRTDFGMTGMLQGVGDDVQITVSLEGGK